LRGEQALLAAVVAAALLAMMAAWFYQGGSRGRLIEIDRAEPVKISFQVDINRADWPELAQLPDVGETLARRIVDSRLSEGPFRDHDDLQRVRVIGPKTLAQIKPYLLPMASDENLAGR
jgi:competence protein ComEA